MTSDRPYLVSFPGTANGVGLMRYFSGSFVMNLQVICLSSSAAILRVCCSVVLVWMGFLFLHHHRLVRARVVAARFLLRCRVPFLAFVMSVCRCSCSQQASAPRRIETPWQRKKAHRRLSFCSLFFFF